MQDGRRVGDWIADRYEIFDIHTGGMGVVYVVYDHQGSSGQRVLAIKTLRDEFLRDPKSNARFVTECGAWIALDRHPYIVRAYSVQVIQGKPHAVLELVTGGDLRRWIGTPRLDLRQVLRFSVQFCLGMEHATLKGLHCHRDIKPENLLVSEGGTLKITDFGLAKVKAEAIEAATAWGHDAPIPLSDDGPDLLAFNPESAAPIVWGDRPSPTDPNRATTLNLPEGPDPFAEDFDPNRTVDIPGAPDPDFDMNRTADLPGCGGVPTDPFDDVLATVDWEGTPRSTAETPPMANPTPRPTR